MQFELIADTKNWTPSTKAILLVKALTDEAIVLASFLTHDTKRYISELCAAMANRFGNQEYPETYRQKLHTLKNYDIEKFKRMLQGSRC